MASIFVTLPITEVYVTLPLRFHEGEECDPYKPRSKKVRHASAP